MPDISPNQNDLLNANGHGPLLTVVVNTVEQPSIILNLHTYSLCPDKKTVLRTPKAMDLYIGPCVKHHVVSRFGLAVRR